MGRALGVPQVARGRGQVEDLTAANQTDVDGSVVSPAGTAFVVAIRWRPGIRFLVSTYSLISFR